MFASRLVVLGATEPVVAMLLAVAMGIIIVPDPVLEPVATSVGMAMG